MAKRRQPAALRKYWATHRKSRSNRKRSPARRRRTRRNPWPMAGTVAAMNPRRRSRKRRSNPRRHRRSRRNPSLLGFNLPPLQSVIYVGAGFIGVPMVEGFLTRFLPVSITGTTLGKYATRIGAVLGLSFLAKMVVGRSEARMVGIGGGAYVLTTAITEFAPSGLIPGLSSYAQPSLAAYAGGTGRTFNGLGAPDFGAQNTVRSAPFGGARIVAQRFRRFQ